MSLDLDLDLDHQILRPVLILRLGVQGFWGKGLRPGSLTTTPMECSPHLTYWLHLLDKLLHHIQRLLRQTCILRVNATTQEESRYLTPSHLLTVTGSQMGNTRWANLLCRVSQMRRIGRKPFFSPQTKPVVTLLGGECDMTPLRTRELELS